MPDLRHATVYPGSKKRAKTARYRASAVRMILIFTRSSICAPAGRKNHLNIATRSSRVSLPVLSATTPCWHHPGIQPSGRFGAVARGISTAQKLVVTGSATMVSRTAFNEALFMALLFHDSPPDPIRDTHQRAQQLRLEVARLVLRFREKERTLQHENQAA